MKSNKTCRLPWPVLLVVLLATVGAISIGLTSATPVSSALDQLPTERTSESIERIPTSKPDFIEENVELTKRRLKIAKWYCPRVNSDYRATKRDLGAATASEEEESKSESEDGVDLSKRRMISDNPYSWALRPSKHGRPATASSEEGMSEPVVE